MSVAIIGAGRVGSSVGYLLKRAGYEISGVAARTMDSAAQAVRFIGSGKPETDVVRAAKDSDLVFITTPDRVIREVCDLLASASAFRPDMIAIHMSGAHSLGLLDSAARAGAARCVLHPLQSLANREQGIRTLPGSYFRIEADSGAEGAARAVVHALGGLELALPQWRSDKDSAALYHAGAVAVSNYFVTLIDYGLTFYQSLGADKEEALRAILPLIKGTLQNIETLGIPDALTGPIMRGDVQTVREHLEAMERRAPELANLYKELGRRTVTVAREKAGIGTEVAEELLTLMR